MAAGPFTASATWEARICVYNLIFPQSNRSQTPFCIDKYGLTKPTKYKINYYTSAQPSIFPFATSSSTDLVPRFYSYSRPSSTGHLCVHGSCFSGFPWLRIKSNFLQSTSIPGDPDGPPHLSHLGTPGPFHSSAHPLPRPLPASGPCARPEASSRLRASAQQHPLREAFHERPLRRLPPPLCRFAQFLAWVRSSTVLRTCLIIG